MDTSVTFPRLCGHHRSRRRLVVKLFSRDLQPIFGTKSAVVIGTRANKRQGMSADVRGGGRLRDEPKECLRRRLVPAKLVC